MPCGRSPPRIDRARKGSAIALPVPIAPLPRGGTVVDGACDPRFEPVREAFAGNFSEHDELGAAVCVYVGGRCVVDLWGGHRDAQRSAAWRRDTLVNAYSVGKGILAALALLLVERGRLELDTSVTRLWPAFASGDKQATTLRMLLSHRAGLPSVRRRLPEGAMFDWRLMCDALAEQRPFWTPGEAHGYHVNTFGFLVGELVRRATGQDVGSALRERLTGPLEAGFFFGLPREEHARVAPVVAWDEPLLGRDAWARVFPPTGDDERDTMIWHSYFNPSGLSGAGAVNTPAWRLAQMPSTNGHADARGVAAIYAALLRGELVSNALLGEATRVYSEGEDRVLGRASRFGLGFQLEEVGGRFGPSGEAFGHYGYGGSLGFADPDAGLAVGYLTNRPGERFRAPRAQRLVDAVYAALGA